MRNSILPIYKETYNVYENIYVIQPEKPFIPNKKKIVKNKGQKKSHARKNSPNEVVSNFTSGSRELSWTMKNVTKFRTGRIVVVHIRTRLPIPLHIYIFHLRSRRIVKPASIICLVKRIARMKGEDVDGTILSSRVSLRRCGASFLKEGSSFR